MKMKNDSERDYIKEAFDKLYNCVMPFVDLTQFSNADTAFKELDKKVHSEIYILKKCLAESDRAVEAGLTRSEVDRKRISDLEERLNRERKHGEDLADINCQLALENVNLKEKTSRLERANSVLRGDNEILWSKLEEVDIPKHPKRPWHGDANAMAGEQELKFGDVVNVTWSSDDYMYIEKDEKHVKLYNIDENRLCYMSSNTLLTKIGRCNFIIAD